MKNDFKIYLLCYYNGQLINFLLPVYTLEQFATQKEIAGTCFKIQNPHNVEIVLAYHNQGDADIIRINIENACKANANISFSIVIDEKNNRAYLRAFTDKKHNGFYLLPTNFIKNACFI